MTHNFTEETFCTQPFSNIQISPQGLYKICCLANDDEHTGHIQDETGAYMHVLDHSIADAFNSVTHREHRLQLSRNEKPARCVNCYDKDTHSKTSVRRVRNNMKDRIIEIVDIADASKILAPSGIIQRSPVSLDIRFGNLCNAKCIVCNAGQSSMWMEDAVQLYGDSAKVKFGENITQLGSSSKWWETDEWWEKFASIAPSLRTVYVVGGEPLIVPEHDTMLEKLISWDYAKNIELEYDTNLTVINPKLIKLWKHFKNIVLRISIDETEDRYHFVRYPSDWNRLLTNIDILKKENIPIICFTSSIGLPTIYSPFRLEKFSKEYNINYAHRFLYTPHHMNIVNLPSSAKEEIIKTYKSNPDKTGAAGVSVINHLSNYFDSYDPQAIKNFIQYMDKLDIIRKTNWKNTLPDVFDLLTRHCPESFGK